ncbi:MAG TPA: hypothetical protein VN704_12610 [Verrucomicrobiae bacterium]|nr:hypothetical protein [Verrucomicrobiae bacterium]
MFLIQKLITDEIIEEKITQLKSIHPKLATVAEKIHNMDLKETVNTLIAADALETLLKIHVIREARGNSFTDEAIQQIVKELKPKHPVFADIVERGNQMDVRETVGALIVVQALERFLKIHAARLATD